MYVITFRHITLIINRNKDYSTAVILMVINNVQFFHQQNKKSELYVTKLSETCTVKSKSKCF